MTATFVVDNHDELLNVGTVSHSKIDNHFISGSFVVLDNATSLGSARTLVVGPGLTLVDEGPGGNVIISAPTSQPHIRWNEKPSGTMNGINDTFVLQFSPQPKESLSLFENGILLSQGDDYLLSGSVITFILEKIPRQNYSLFATYPY